MAIFWGLPRVLVRPWSLVEEIASSVVLGFLKAVLRSRLLDASCCDDSFWDPLSVWRLDLLLDIPSLKRETVLVGKCAICKGLPNFLFIS